MADVDANETIAVTGMGVVTSLGAAPDTLFRALVQGKRGFSKIRAFDTTGCRVDIAAEAPLPAVSSKPSLVSHGAYTRTAALALHAASAALQQAALPAEARAGAALALGSAGAGTRPPLAELRRR